MNEAEKGWPGEGDPRSAWYPGSHVKKEFQKEGMVDGGLRLFFLSSEIRNKVMVSAPGKERRRQRPDESRGRASPAVIPCLYRRGHHPRPFPPHPNLTWRGRAPHFPPICQLFWPRFCPLLPSATLASYSLARELPRAFQSPTSQVQSPGFPSRSPVKNWFIRSCYLSCPHRDSLPPG